MSQLTINGIEIPVAADSWAVEPVEIGERGRAADGSSLSQIVRRYYRRSGSAICTDAEQARALECLICGDGIGWSFDSDLYSDRSGLGYSTGGTAPTVVASDGGVSPKFGAKFLKLPSGGSVVWTHGLAAASWSACWWWWSGSAWVHMAIRSDTSGSYWRDGVLTSGTPAYVTAATGALTISQGISGVTHYLDDVVYLPYLAPASWFATWAAATSAYPKPPFLTIGGTLAAYGGATCRGKATRSQYTNRGALAHLQRVEFSLEEA